MLRTTVNSFDIFDTLLARRCITPDGIARELERRYGATGFAELRWATEQRLLAEDRAFDIHDIYAAMVEAGQLGRADAYSLLNAEIEAEFDQAVPIVENIQRVRAGDLLISDMYLPRDIVRRLLQSVGLRQPVTIYLSNLGKHRGSAWQDLAAGWIIHQHLGDNPHSDVAMPARHGIPAIHYTGARPNAIEQSLLREGYPTLAQLMRVNRLRNPFPIGSAESEMWLLSARLNLPLLVLVAAHLHRLLENIPARRLLFSDRDCYLLSEVYSSLYPADAVDYLHVSRKMLGGDMITLDAYLAERGLENAIVCDMAATGGSWCDFAARAQRPVHLFSVVAIDNWPKAPMSAEEIHQSPWLRFDWLATSSGLTGYTNALEVLNTAPYASCHAIERRGRQFVPMRDPRHELPEPILHALFQQHVLALEGLRRARSALLAELQRPAPATLIADLINAMSSAPLLNSLGSLL